MTDPLLDLAAVAALLDANGLGRGELKAQPLGEGHSNLTYLLERGGERFVLRRPPRPPLPPSAHDMLREARVQEALGAAGARVPRVLLVCADESALGVPFYVMEYLAGEVATDRLAGPLGTPAERRRIGVDLVDALAEIHAVDWAACGLESFGRPTGYLERQVRRFSGLWEHNATRDLPEVGELAAWLDGARPESGPASVVHGDFRLGNVLLAPEAPGRVRAVLDWELSTLGDPLADLGYLLATWGDRGSPRSPMELSPVTREEGFPTRVELAARYEEQTGRALAALPWYEALALWKAAVFCEEIYGRFLRGETADPFSASLGEGVPALLAAAAACAARA